ncbi:MAG: DUF2490 domain-containing protein [Bacteroidales bacterium]|jgi:hypothetical protein|nr:DUF2490 domain-containing protein [Bacteroidales bacterium]
MNRLFAYCFPILLFPVVALAQPQRDTKYGASLAAEVEKSLLRNLNLSVEEEIRLINNQTGFNRNVTSAGFNYSLMDKKLKLGASYSFIYLYNNDFRYEMRHRLHANVTFRETVGPFVLSWRTRIQESIRNPRRGSYRVNPRYVLKNRLEAEYVIWGKPWKPFLSCEMSINLNDPQTRYDPTRLRFCGGADWRLNRSTSLSLFIRWDEQLKGADPRVIAPGISYKVRM